MLYKDLPAPQSQQHAKRMCNKNPVLDANRGISLVKLTLLNHKKAYEIVWKCKKKKILSLPLETGVKTYPFDLLC